ncbi:MarR family transcriptional regulator [Aliivibrio fischeri]|uniref:MarR family transcriptional regulator n=1 Tax=Aliivibrio fischeri TaxID=668 RepID=UPI001F2D3372|nr:MarR family transcriptional regulator [Aliivibrio fischeri]MCE7553616.1 MarR family transcriptional regulator [Aliivibrio fischeri]MCE7561532.1 MarR family transcriptional regulator [Aliivibrio fischeri]MCE7568940.1 MarR family transcriptional regulator [Aliivibrio fischeri]
MSNLAKNEHIPEDLLKCVRSVPHQVGMLKLSKTQLIVLQSIKEGEEVTSSQIADRCGLSSSWASSLLKRLNEKCYLSRSYMQQLTGGVEFKYMKQ